MKKLGVFLFFILLIGCSRVIIDNINLNEDKTANIGEVFFDHKEGVRGVGVYPQRQ